MAVGTLVKRLQDVMRQDAGINGDAQRIEQMAWLLFLKVYDAREEAWELADGAYRSIIPERLRWRSWAPDRKDGNALTGDDLLNFVNNELFPGLKNLELSEGVRLSQAIVRSAFEDNNNYMKNGVLLRQVINSIEDIDFSDYKERHAFGEIYETILKSLQSAGNAGEFYTPRAVTDFMAERVRPEIGDRIADFACGTGGFLTSAIKVLEGQIERPSDRGILNSSVFGIEKKALPHLLCVTNMFLHDVDNPQIFHTNALERDVRDFQEADRFDIILMNPPYGGNESESVKRNFPKAMQSSETADLFLALIMYRLKRNGSAAVIVPDGFLFGNDNAKLAIKEKLLSEFNLHTVIRLPAGVFAPYTSITTNILFFDNDKPTEKTWFYRVDRPAGLQSFSKTRQFEAPHLDEARKWWNFRQEIVENGFDKARCLTQDELRSRNYNLDLCGYPQEDQGDLKSPETLFRELEEQRAVLNAELDHILGFLSPLLKNGQAKE